MAAEHAEFVFANAPGWLGYLFAILAFALGWWAWRRYGPAPSGIAGRIARICRVAALVLVVVLLAGPALRQTTVSSEPGTIVVAVDRSASMARDDGVNGSQRIAAAVELKAQLDELQAMRNVRIAWYGIGNGVTAIDPTKLDELDAQGPRSALGEDLVQLSFLTRPDCLLLLSDGRVTAGSSLPATGERLARQGVPAHGVWALAPGGTTIDPSLTIEDLSVPRQAPLGERVPVRLRLTGRNLGEGDIRVVMERGGEVVAEATLSVPESDSDDPLALDEIEIELEVVFPDEGEHRLSIRVEQADLSDRSEVTVNVIQRKLQVLMLTHRPRYEMRYLRVALDRDLTVTVHSYLADGRWRRWGDDNYGPDTKPFTSAALADYDVIIIGDIGADAFRSEQLDAIADHVRDRGAGLVWVPGSRGSATTFRGSRLGNLLPVRLGDAATLGRGYLDNAERQLEPSETAAAMRLLTLDRDEWANLPLLRTGAPIIEVVAGSQVLAVDSRSGSPLVVSRDYDAGRALFIGTDDTWRWRRNVGDHYLHRFYSQLLRFVSAGRGQGDARWRTAIAPRETTPGEPVQLGVVPNGTVGDLDALPREITLRLQRGDDELFHRLHRGDRQRSFLNTIPAPAPGEWKATVVDGLALDEVVPADLLVLPPRDELRDPRIDADALRELATTTGGRLILLGDAHKAGVQPSAALVNSLPALDHQQATTQVEAVWDEWWVLCLLIVVLGIEWAVRRWFRLP
ncbi:MAG: hypothetical protein PF961_01760 [Planctomycetota bacterium]|jgi:uncharacterized membrane protein|nr:hypothetical protein [Planctomycetota bacterium]